MFFEEVPASVTYIFDFTNPLTMVHSAPSALFYPKLLDTVKFDSLTFPLKFSIIAHMDTGVEINGDIVLPNCTGPPVLTTTVKPTIPVVTVNLNILYNYYLELENKLDRARNI